MAVGVQARLAIKGDGVNHQGVALPAPHGIPEPGGIWIFRMRPAVDGRHMEPTVLLIQHRDVLIVLNDLDRMRPAHAAHQPKRQATSGVVALGGVRKLARAFAAGRVLGDIGHARALPHSAKIRVAIGQPRRGTFRRFVGRRLAERDGDPKQGGPGDDRTQYATAHSARSSLSVDYRWTGRVSSKSAIRSAPGPGRYGLA